MDVLFDGEGESLGFARPDQMTWLATHPSYNWRQSPFWRVISKVSQDYTEGEWFNGIAWSNLCKIAPSEAGNPSDSWKYMNDFGLICSEDGNSLKYNYSQSE